MEKLVKFLIVLGSTYMSLLHPSEIIFGVLIIVNIVDYVTGILGAVSKGEKISIEKSFKGIVKKLNKLFFILVSLSIDVLITHNFSPDKPVSPVSAAVITWLVINELVSICFNIANGADSNIPPAIKQFLEKFKEV